MLMKCNLFLLKWNQRHTYGRGIGSDGPCAAIKSGLSEIKSEISLLRYDIRNAHNGGNMSNGKCRKQAWKVFTVVVHTF